MFPPKGTLITPEWPAPTNARSFVLLRCLGLLAGVVAQAVDGRMPADQETIRYTGFYGTDRNGKRFLSREVLGGVITSYSIHYTKLYEFAAPPGDGAETARALAGCAGTAPIGEVGRPRDNAAGTVSRKVCRGIPPGPLCARGRQGAQLHQGGGPAQPVPVGRQLV